MIGERLRNAREDIGLKPSEFIELIESHSEEQYRQMENNELDGCVLMCSEQSVTWQSAPAVSQIIGQRYLGLADRARVLFAEASFHSMRFTAEDAQQAFEAVGYPPRLKLDERTAKTMADAILHVADPERRRRDSLRLMSLDDDFISFC